MGDLSYRLHTRKADEETRARLAPLETPQTHGAATALDFRNILRRRRRRRAFAYRLHVERAVLRPALAHPGRRLFKKVPQRAEIHLHRRRAAVTASVDRRRRGDL